MSIPHDQRARLRQLEELHNNNGDVANYESHTPEVAEEIFNVPPEEDNQ